MAAQLVYMGVGMAVVWHKTKFLGVRYREHKSRKHGVQFDRCFSIRYKADGKDKEESVGWASEGITAEKAFKQLSLIRENMRTGEGACSIKELRELNQAQAKEVERTEEEFARKNVTFEYFWENEYFPTAKMSKKESSATSELHLYNNWIKSHIGSLPFAEITPQVLEKLLMVLQTKKKSAATIRYVFAVISQVWRKAALQGLATETSPTSKVKKPQQDNRRMRFLTQEEAHLLLEELGKKSQDVKDISLLSLYCGLRVGEIHALTWGDINFEDDTIFIRDPKSGKNRHAFITRKVREMLLSRKAGQAKVDLIFPAVTGGKRKAISHTFIKTVNALGFNNTGEYRTAKDGSSVPIIESDARQKVVFHSLRHTFASWLVQKGTPLYTVAKLMGHSTLEMTQRYSHLAPDTLRQAAMVLDEE